MATFRAFFFTGSLWYEPWLYQSGNDAYEVLCESLTHDDISSFENRAAVIPSFQQLVK